MAEGIERVPRAFNPVVLHVVAELFGADLKGRTSNHAILPTTRPLPPFHCTQRVTGFPCQIPRLEGKNVSDLTSRAPVLAHSPGNRVIKTAAFLQAVGLGIQEFRSSQRANQVTAQSWIALFQFGIQRVSIIAAVIRFNGAAQFMALLVSHGPHFVEVNHGGQPFHGGLGNLGFVHQIFPEGYGVEALILVLHPLNNVIHCLRGSDGPLPCFFCFFIYQKFFLVLMKLACVCSGVFWCIKNPQVFTCFSEQFYCFIFR